MKHGGKQTAEGRAADAAAKRAAEALAEAEVDLGRDIDSATYGGALVHLRLIT